MSSEREKRWKCGESSWIEEDMREFDRAIIESIWDALIARAKNIKADYYIPDPETPLTDKDLVKYVDDYVLANLVLH